MRKKNYIVPNNSMRVLQEKKTILCQIILCGYPLVTNLSLIIYIYNIFYHLPKLSHQGKKTIIKPK